MTFIHELYYYYYVLIVFHTSKFYINLANSDYTSDSDMIDPFIRIFYGPGKYCHGRGQVEQHGHCTDVYTPLLKPGIL